MSYILKAGDRPPTEFMSSKEKFSLLPPSRRKTLIESMSDEEAAKLEYDWEYCGRPKQLPPHSPKSLATSFCMCRYLAAQATSQSKLKLESFPPCDNSTDTETLISYEKPDNLDGWTALVKNGDDYIPSKNNELGDLWVKKGEVVPKGKVCGFRNSWSIWVLLAGRGFGKATCVDTPVPTPSGWTTMGAIKDGDTVFDERGNQTTVVKAHDQYFTEDVYKITFSDKTTIVADKDHLWSIWEHNDCKQYGRYDESVRGSFPDDWATYRGDKYDCWGNVKGYFGAKTVSTEELKHRLDKSPRIPLTAPLNLPVVDLPIDPWTLGYWLGNGDTKVGGVHTGSYNGEFDFEFVKSKFAYEITKERGETNCGYIYSSELHSLLKENNLLGNKHVPKIYLRASKEQRLALLQGLMDSDGYPGNDNNFVGFSSTVQNLADSVYELTVSLGEKPLREEGHGILYGIEKKYCWGIAYRPNINPFSLPRKANRITPPIAGRQGLRHKHRIIRSVEKVPGRYVRCLTVDSPSSLYLVGNQMVPTHNTRVGAELVHTLIDTGEAKRVHIISPTAADARDVAVEGESGILNITPSWNRPNYESTKRRLTWNSGAVATLFSAEEADRLRGPQADLLWCDELAAWDPNEQQAVWDMAMFGLRLGKNPRAVVTTTPKPTQLIQHLVKMAKNPENRVIITTGSTYENRSNLAAPFMRQIGQYEGTNLGRQEIYAELIDIEESGIIKRTWFKQWKANKPLPYIHYVIQSYDTAFTDRTENDPTACTVWGVFKPSPEDPYCVMLLDCWTEHLKYPELRNRAKEEYLATYGEQEAKVDLVLIEDKGSGIPLIHDLQRAGLPVKKYNPGRPDKVMRLHAVSHLVYNGRVYIPESKSVAGEYVTWAEPFIREVCAFPNSPHDDLVDTFSQALALFRDQEWLFIDAEPVVDPYEEEERELNGYSNPYAV